jgi:hypothetical protein
MVVVTVNNNSFYLHPELKNNLDFTYPKVMSGKYKFIGIVDGRSGYGKTTLVSQFAYYLSKGTLTLDDFCFNKKQALDRIKNSKPGTNVIIDEAFSVANKRTSRGQENMDFLSDLQKMRIKRIFLWIILPSLYDLDKNIILSFTDLFLHVYGKPFGEKGNFAAYDIEGIKNLYLYCRQTLDYKKQFARPNFYGNFTSFFPLDPNEYDKKKESSKSYEENIKPTKYMLQRDSLIMEMKKLGISVDDIASKIGMKQDGVYEILQKYQEKKAIIPNSLAQDKEILKIRHLKN